MSIVVAEPIKCHECGLERAFLVRIGEKPALYANHADICYDCLRKAIELLVSHAGKVLTQ